MFVPAAKARLHYNVGASTLRRWAAEGKVPVQKTNGGHYRYRIDPVVEPPPDAEEQPSPNVVYARVSSAKQRGDLQRQVSFLRRRCPAYSVVTDVASGLNYKRSGFQAILGQLFQGRIQRVVVAHGDRFSRFGFEFFQWLFQQFGAVLVSLAGRRAAPGEELIGDLMEVLTVFTARYHGSRSYKQGRRGGRIVKANLVPQGAVLSNQGPEGAV
jgi:predicted site-specific integrase-resolvase